MAESRCCVGNSGKLSSVYSTHFGGINFLASSLEEELLCRWFDWKDFLAVCITFTMKADAFHWDRERTLLLALLLSLR